MHTRTVFFISDGTGITAETFGNAILAQFEMKPRHVRLPFIDSVDKAHQAVRQINHTAEVEGKKPIVFTTLVNMEVLKVIQEGCKGMLLDMFGTFVHPLETELGIKSQPPRRPLQRREQEQGIPRPHRGHQFQPCA
jgi:regulator of PEP synthase PpsR (kinase-PPPase family)